MSGFVYHLPDAQGALTPDHLKRAGLGYAFPPGCEVHCRESEGPSGKRGLLVAMSDKLLGFSVKEQDWLEMAGLLRDVDKKPVPWVGLWKDARRRPGPVQLQRAKRCIEGHAVLLGDGHAWQIPVVRGVRGGCALPRIVIVDSASGRATERVRAEYQVLMDLSLSLWHGITEAWEEGRKAEPSIEDILKLGSESLAVNYRVRRWEISLLELLDTENAAEVADAVVDGPSLRILLEELGKKKETSAAGSTSLSGGTE